MGSALSERVRAALPHIALTENYGQSEACPITVRCERHGIDKRQTVGRAASNAELGVVDQTGTLLPAGEIGDIYASG